MKNGTSVSKSKREKCVLFFFILHIFVKSDSGGADVRVSRCNSLLVLEPRKSPELVKMNRYRFGFIDPGFQVSKFNFNFVYGAFSKIRYITITIKQLEIITELQYSMCNYIDRVDGNTLDLHRNWDIKVLLLWLWVFTGQASVTLFTVTCPTPTTVCANDLWLQKD